MTVSRSIVEFFKRTESLLDPKGPLSSSLSSPCISASNKAIQEAQRQQKEPESRCSCVKLSDELKAEIARYEADKREQCADVD